MKSFCMYTLLFCLWNSFSGTVLGQSARPTNLNHFVVTNHNCATIINLRWTRPNSSWEVSKYIIEYWTKQFDNMNVTVNAKTIVTADGNKTEKNITVSGSNVNAYFKIAANFSRGNETYSTGPWSSTITVVIPATGCNSTKIDGNNEGRGTAYVLKLVGIIIGASIGIMIIFFAALRIYVWRKEKRYSQSDMSRKEKRGHQLMLIDHELPVSVDSFFDHVSSMKFNTSKGFKTEWAMLATSSDQPFSFGNRPVNAAKNRYTNVPTLDKTRVILEQQNGQNNSTYINANFVDSIERPKAYIATQAPLHDTISDFWRMIWEQEVRHIVMIVSLREQDNITCCKYWPDEGEYKYGKVTVKMLDITKYADYSIRRFEIRCKGETESRLISQFHYHSWPMKMPVPVHPTSFLEFVKTVALYRVNSMQPVVVHCSSGNGRTGVFIIVDSQLKRINTQNNVNIFFNVDSIRHQRYQIIRNVEEYIFIHECILDHVTCMNRIDIIPRDLADVIGKQREVNEDGVKNFQLEFDEVLNGATAMHNKSTIAKLPQNKSKNRFENILPYDHTRVKLRKADRVTSDGRDFINASYFSSMRRQRNYIITQNPMESTIFDFWCMVWENSSLTIVMLSYQEEDIVSYWPDENEVLKAGKIEVRSISVEKQKNFDIRHLEISHNEADATKLVRQYQYKGHPENSNEDSIKTYVDFIVQCNKWHDTSKCRTMVVHCRAGTGKSGTFVAISQLMEKLNASSTINVFKTVKRLLQDRMAVIQTLNQYEMLYLAIELYYKTYYMVQHEYQDLEEDSTQTSISDTAMT